MDGEKTKLPPIEPKQGIVSIHRTDPYLGYMEVDIDTDMYNCVVVPEVTVGMGIVGIYNVEGNFIENLACTLRNPTKSA